MDGFAIAAQSMVGNALGADDPGEARSIARDLVRWGLAGGALLGGVLLVARTPLASLFTSDAAVLAAIAGVWWLACVGHVANALAFALDGVLMGAADFRYLRTWTVVAALVGGVLGQVGVSLGAGLLWLWACVELLMLVRVASLAWRIRGTAWLHSELAR